MAPLSWDSWYVGCPYYVDDDRDRRIICEGPEEESRLIWQFETHQAMKLQIRGICCENWKGCEVYQMLKSVYEEDDL